MPPDPARGLVGRRRAGPEVPAGGGAWGGLPGRGAGRRGQPAREVPLRHRSGVCAGPAAARGAAGSPLPPLWRRTERAASGRAGGREGVGSVPSRRESPCAGIYFGPCAVPGTESQSKWGGKGAVPGSPIVLAGRARTSPG